jgi:hypothetical protein
VSITWAVLAVEAVPPVGVEVETDWLEDEPPSVCVVVEPELEQEVRIDPATTVAARAAAGRRLSPLPHGMISPLSWRL